MRFLGLVLTLCLLVGCGSRDAQSDSPAVAFDATASDRRLTSAEHGDVRRFLADQGASQRTLSSFDRLGPDLVEKVGNDFCRNLAVNDGVQAASSAYSRHLRSIPDATEGYVFDLVLIGTITASFMCFDSM